MLELLFATIVAPLEVFPGGCVLFMILEPENNKSKVLFLVMVNLRTDKIVLLSTALHLPLVFNSFSKSDTRVFNNLTSSVTMLDGGD